MSSQTHQSQFQLIYPATPRLRRSNNIHFTLPNNLRKDQSLSFLSISTFPQFPSKFLILLSRSVLFQTYHSKGKFSFLGFGLLTKPFPRATGQFPSPTKYGNPHLLKTPKISGETSTHPRVKKGVLEKCSTVYLWFTCLHCVSRNHKLCDNKSETSLNWISHFVLFDRKIVKFVGPEFQTCSSSKFTIVVVIPNWLNMSTLLIAFSSVPPRVILIGFQFVSIRGQTTQYLILARKLNNAGMFYDLIEPLLDNTSCSRRPFNESLYWWKAKGLWRI